MKMQCEDLIGVWYKHLALIGEKKTQKWQKKCIVCTKHKTDNIPSFLLWEKSPLAEKNSAQKVCIFILVFLHGVLILRSSSSVLSCCNVYLDFFQSIIQANEGNKVFQFIIQCCIVIIIYIQLMTSVGQLLTLLLYEMLWSQSVLVVMEAMPWTSVFKFVYKQQVLVWIKYPYHYTSE